MTAAVTLVLALLAGRTYAGTPVVDLGKPLNIQSTSPFFPLSGFHRIKQFMRAQGKPELLFLGAQGEYDPIIGERWAVVKALDQFGRLSGVKAVDNHCTATRGAPTAETFCTLATFDFTHARYSSPYLAFTSRDLIRDGKHDVVAFQPLNKTEMQLFDQYSRPRTKPICYREDANGMPIKSANGQFITYPCPDFAHYAWESATNTKDTRSLPLVAVGNYLETIPQITIAPDLSMMVAVSPVSPGQNGAASQHAYSFSAIQQALITDKDPIQSYVVEHVNAEANVITALVCHADGNRPSAVCHRTVIRQIERHVR